MLIKVRKLAIRAFLKERGYGRTWRFARARIYAIGLRPRDQALCAAALSLLTKWNGFVAGLREI